MAPTTADHAVVVDGLTKVYEPLPRWMKLLTRTPSRRTVVALDAVDLVVDPGQICAVVGPNGAGKSTLFRVLMGLTPPTSGSASVLEVPCETGIARRGVPIGFMPAEDRTLLLRLSCRDNLVFQAQMRGFSGTGLTRRVGEVLELVGLTSVGDRAAFALSSGMRARLQLGRALVHQPEVLVLDEPTSAVDPVAAYDLLQFIQDLARTSGIAVLLSSHRLEEIDALDELVLLLDRGRAVFSGDLRRLRALADVTEVTLDFVDSAVARRVADDLRSAGRFEDVRVAGRELMVKTPDAVGDVLSAVGPDIRHLVHVDEHSGSTRELLQRLYRATETDEPKP